jgi:pimeloyl-ACP methyl ester carboxylesterase
MDPREHDVATAGGRVLRVLEAGDPDGPVVVVHHGTPGGRLLHRPWVEAARSRGLRLVSFDRPGYGGSSPRPGRTVADLAADVATILDAIGAARFATLGASGGGPHALACAALLPDRCAAVATLAGVAPFDAEGLDWLAGQGEANRDEWAAVQSGREAIEAFCEREAAELVQATGPMLVELLGSILSPPDAAVLSAELGDYLAASARDALAPGVEGWVEDDFAFLAPWGFELDRIEVPVLLWQGVQDLMVPTAHGRWLAGRIPGVEAHVSDEDGHLTLWERRWPSVLDWLARYTF